jgi:membrane-associated protease RseP (regulator of RpoE activity)
MEVKMIRKKLFFFVASMVPVFVLAGLILLAQEETSPKPLPEQSESSTKVPEHYLGIQCGPLPQLLSDHLNLDDKGVLIQAVVLDSPADKAGLKSGDILLSIADKEVKAVTDIFAVLEKDQDKEQTVIVLQKGKKNELKITPEKRPDSPVLFGVPSAETMRMIQPRMMIPPGFRFDGRNNEDAQRLIRKLFEQMDSMGIHAEMVDPNEMLSGIPRREERLGDVFKSDPNTKVERFGIQISPGNEPGSQRITVQQNNEIWEVERIEDLPENLQEKVRDFTMPRPNRPNVPLPRFHAY